VGQPTVTSPHPEPDSVAPGDDPAGTNEDLASDNPEAYIARDRRQALADRVEMPDRIRGSALFADISGFTPLTEALANELGPQRGAEELTANLGRVFHAVIAELDRYGGNVIYFSGDAITCWIDGDDGLRGAAAAFAMQEAMARVGEIVTPGGTVVRLALKVAVACGAARRFVVGDPEIQLIDVLAGRLIDDLAEAEHHANKGEVVLDHSAVAALGHRVIVDEERVDTETGKTFGVARELTVEVDEAPAGEPEPLADELVRPWLLPAVYERLRSGRGEFLAELRPAYPLFLRFGGIDYDDDDEAIAKLDDFVRRAQRIMAGYGGNVLQLTLGDKGAYLYGVFGSPVAHEDDAARAAAAALELRDLEKTTEARGIQIGVTHGRLRSGTYGHAMRRTFVCLGDAVNLSARLMSAAPEGRIFVNDHVRESAGDAFIWERLPDLSVKGKSGVIVAHELTGSLERASRRKIRYELPLIGRQAELAVLDDALETAIGGSGRIVAIAAEAGMGKSRLVAEFVRSARRRGLFVAFGECQSFGTNSSYFVWREIWRRLLRIDDTAEPAVQLAHVEDELRAIDPGLVARAPLLETVLGLEIPDSDLTAAFDAKLRKASLEDLLATCLRARSATEPVVLVLEDCHWIDELSHDLLEVIGRATAGLSVLVVLAYRPSAEVGGGLGIERLPAFSEVGLAVLDEADATALIRSKLEQLTGSADAAGDSLVALVTERSGGNPFYVEELISFIASQGIDPADEGSLRSVELPESLHSLVLSRIDTVAEQPRRTLKVASVVGRLFRAPILPGAYPELGTIEGVVGHLDSLRALDLVTLDREAEQAYLFKHVVTQEVAYESLPFAVRATLHGRIGRFLEADAGDGVDRIVDLLAHHFSHSEDQPKQIEYLRRAAIAAQAAYSNAAAIDYYERLVPLLDGSDRVATMLKLAKVLQLVGALGRAESTALEARTMASDLDDLLQVAWADASLAETAKRQSRFEEATARLDAAIGRFRGLDDAAGVGDMLHLAGVIAQLQGDYATAKERYEDSRRVREGIDDWAGVATTGGNLAILAEFDGDYPAALRINADALELRRRIGDRRGIGIGEMNAGYYWILNGDLETARKHLEEALRLSRELGDRAMIAHSTFTLGNAMRDLGDHATAAERYAEALALQRELDDRFSLTFILEDVGVLLAWAGEAEQGFELLGGAEAVRQQIGSPRPPTLDVELAGHFAKARQAVGEEAAEAAIARGKAWSFEEAIEAALLASSRVRA
jgi:class 3 adenylate cyclase/tetratricopeptide (TPR) repeat protein